MSTITVPSKPDHARSFFTEQGKPSAVLRAQDRLSDLNSTMAITCLSPGADQRELAQQPCYCIGCDDIHPWERMRWDGPLLLCQGCIHALCDHYPGRDRTRHRTPRRCSVVPLLDA